MKKTLITLLLIVLMATPCYGMTCHELAMSYILADQDKPRAAGDIYYVSENEPNPLLCETTAYFEGTHGSHGDKMREGYAAASPEMYGDVVMVYEAIPKDDGSYEVGNFITQVEIRDCGYGYPTGQGKSEVRTDKKSKGSIECGVHLDVYKDNYQRCKEWMTRTNGKIFAVVIEGKG